MAILSILAVGVGASTWPRFFISSGMNVSEAQWDKLSWAWKKAEVQVEEGGKGPEDRRLSASWVDMGGKKNHVATKNYVATQGGLISSNERVAYAWKVGHGIELSNIRVANIRCFYIYFPVEHREVCNANPVYLDNV